MLAAGKRDVALESYAAAEKLLGSDPPRRVEVVARRGQALEGLGKDDDAVAEYKRAIKLAPKGYYLEVELTGRIIDIYRRKQALPQLLAEYEKEWPEGMRGHFEWDTLGKLYEETGAQDKAIAALKKAVAKAPYELETQRRLIQLLENSGRDDEALAQYEVVVRVAPGEARFQLELAERYWRRNDEKKALEVLARLEQRFPQDPSVLGAIADLYTRYNKEDLAITEYERLAKLEPDDISHLVTLGEQYFQKGDKTRAMATWKRIIANNKAASYAKLGEVLAEHGQNFYTEAEKNYQKAIELDPKNPELYKGRASLHEAKKENDKALDDWKMVLSLLGNKPSDRLARRDARRHLVTVLFKANKEASAVADWTRDFGRPPTIGADKKPVYDPIASEAGYFLVEYWSRPGRTKAGEPRATLEKLVAMVPDDRESGPRSREVLPHGHAAQVRRSGRAAPQARARRAEPRARGVQADLRDQERRPPGRRVDRMAAEGGREEPERSERVRRARRALRRDAALPRSDRGIRAHGAARSRANSKAAFALAQLYIQTGTPMKATELYRNILRNDTDEEVLRRAGDQAIDLEEMTGTLGELEKVLSPLSFMMAHKPVYREELIDLYLRYVPLLASRLHHGNDEVKRAARVELDRISAHGLRPLLEALRDDRNVGQQRMAVEVLGYLGNKGAAPPLVHMARQEPSKEQRHIGTLAETLDRDIRVDALVAAGRLGDPGVIEDVLPMMDHQEVALREAATFTVGRSQDRRAVAPLVKALGDRQTSVQVLACLGLAQIDDPRVAPAVIGVAKDPSRLDAVRAACTYAIGARRIAAATPILLAALDDNRGDTQRLAAWALGQLGTGQALGPLLRAYFARAGQSADELVWAIARVSGAGLAPAPIADLGEYPIHAGKFDKEAAIAALPGSLPHAPAVGKLVTDHATDIAAGLAQALGEHRDVVVSVLADLDAAPDQLALGALTPPASDPKAAAALAAVARSIAGDVTAHLGDDDPKVRALAISVTAKLDAPTTAADIAKALADPTEQVRAAAMNAIAVVAHRRGTAPPELVGALAKTLASAGWEDRRAAALALGRLGAKADADALVKAASDSSSFVREAVAIALGQVGGPESRRHPHPVSPRRRSPGPRSGHPVARAAEELADLSGPASLTHRFAGRYNPAEWTSALCATRAAR